MKTAALWFVAVFVSAGGYRLPDTFAPENYRLKVITFLNEDNEGFRFTGKVWISVSDLLHKN